MEYIEKSRSKELENSTKFNQLVYSEIEEIGWDNLVRLSEDLRFLSFRIPDKNGRTHILEIQLDKTYPKSPPSISASVPYIHDLEWSAQFKLENVVRQFREHLERLQEFWSTLEDMDNHLCVDQKMSSTSTRCINIGNDCFVIPSVNANDPKALPEIRFVGSDQLVDTMRKKWQRNSRQWSKDRPFVENLERILETQLPRPPDAQKNEQVECGICYAQRLPIEEEFGEKGGGETDYACENANCKMAFHSLCLVEWLRSITTTRQSFNVLFGNCPYCSDPIAVKINSANQ